MRPAWRLFALMLLGGVTAAPQAGRTAAWTLPQGHGQVILGATPSWADGIFGPDRRAASGAATRKVEAQALFEYGLTGRFTAIVMPGLQHIDIGPPVSASRSGLGYSELGGRYLLATNGPWVVSAQGILRVPGTQDTGNPAAIGYTGLEFDARFLFGTSFEAAGRPAYLDLQLAHRVRGGGPPNEWRVDATFGWRFVPRWLLLAQTFSVISDGAGSAMFPAHDYHKLQLGLGYELSPHWTVVLGGLTTVAGRNALRESGATVSAWYKF